MEMERKAIIGVDCLKLVFTGDGVGVVVGVDVSALPI